MGNFYGHAIPGSFFIIFALWYSVRTFQKYYSSRQRKEPFTSQLMMDCPCLCGRLKKLPVEACIKIIFTSVGIALEILSGTQGVNYLPVGNGQHITMFFFFGLTGVVDILQFYNVSPSKNMDYMSVALALLIEGVIFKFHLHNRSDLDVLVHTLLLYVIFLGAVSVLVEMHHRHTLLPPLTRNYLTLLQGTWFWQIGFILYNPFPGAVPWKKYDHLEMMTATLYFTWHCGVNFVILFVIASAMRRYYNREKECQGTINDEISLQRMIHTGSNGQIYVSLNDDSGSDLECQNQ